MRWPGQTWRWRTGEEVKKKTEKGVVDQKMKRKCEKERKPLQQAAWENKKKEKKKRALSLINLLSWFSPVLHEKQQDWGILKFLAELWEFCTGPCGYTNLLLQQQRWLSRHFAVLRVQQDRMADSLSQDSGEGVNRGQLMFCFVGFIHS